MVFCADMGKSAANSMQLHDQEYVLLLGAWQPYCAM
jgi:hypothetical protein